jgi:hypothetical protein
MMKNAAIVVSILALLGGVPSIQEQIPYLEGVRIKREHDMLADTIALIQNKMKAGKILEQIQDEGLPSKYSEWGTAYTNATEWIKNIYRGLQKENDTNKERVTPKSQLFKKQK